MQFLREFKGSKKFYERNLAIIELFSSGITVLKILQFVVKKRENAVGLHEEQNRKPPSKMQNLEQDGIVQLEDVSQSLQPIIMCKLVYNM